MRSDFACHNQPARPGTIALQGDNKGFLVARQKMSTSLERLCGRWSAPFRQFLEYAISLQYKETPNYRACQALFEPLLGDVHSRPLALDYCSTLGKVGVSHQQAQCFYLPQMYMLHLGS